MIIRETKLYLTEEWKKKDRYDLLKDPEVMMKKAISELAKLILEETPFVK